MCSILGVLLVPPPIFMQLYITMLIDSLWNNKLFVELETFYQNILKDISHLPVDDITKLKTKLRHTCKKYSQIKVPYQYRTIINNLGCNKNLGVLKQAKGTGIVILDKNKYIEKCISIVTTEKVRQQSNSNM